MMDLIYKALFRQEFCFFLIVNGVSESQLCCHLIQWQTSFRALWNLTGQTTALLNCPVTHQLFKNKSDQWPKLCKFYSLKTVITIMMHALTEKKNHNQLEWQQSDST